MKMLRIAFLLSACVLASSKAVASETDATCGGYRTLLYSNNDVALTICHAPYTKISRSLLEQWQNCDDGIIQIRDKKKGVTKKYADCWPTIPKQFMIRGNTLLLRHFFTEYPGFDRKPALIETFNLTTNAKKYEFIRTFPSYTRKAVDDAIKRIDLTIAQPFDGETYFPAVYGGFFKLRDFAVTDPEFVSSVLQKYKKRGVFDGEVAETLSEVIEEVKTISAATKRK